MKKNKNIFMASVLLLSLGLASCIDSFLDVTSKTESSTGTFYKTEQDAYRALIGCYDGWRQTVIRPLTVLTSPSRLPTSTYTKAIGRIIMRGSIVATS